MRLALEEVKGKVVAEEPPATPGAPSWMTVELSSDRLETFLSRLDKMGKLQRYEPVPTVTGSRPVRIRISLREETVVR